MQFPWWLKNTPNVHFICPGMQGEAQAEKWCNELKIGEKVELLPAAIAPADGGAIQAVADHSVDHHP